MKSLCSKLYLTRVIKTQNRAQKNNASVTVDGVTLPDSLGRMFTEWMTGDVLWSSCTSNHPALWTLCIFELTVPQLSSEVLKSNPCKTYLKIQSPAFIYQILQNLYSYTDFCNRFPVILNYKWTEALLDVYRHSFQS
jgi:hypothetical protein